VNGAAQLQTTTVGPTILSAADQRMRKATPEEAALTAKNYRLAKELSDLRVRHREETKNVNRLTMENMNLASRCREAISHVAMLKKEVAAFKRAAASGKITPNRSFDSNPTVEEKQVSPVPQPNLPPSTMPVLSKQHTGRDLDQMDEFLSSQNGDNHKNDTSTGGLGHGSNNNMPETPVALSVPNTPAELRSESPGDIMSPTETPPPSFFPESASPKLRKAYNEEYPADLSATTKRIPSRQRVPKLQGFAESEDDVGESLGSGVLKAAFGEPEEKAPAVSSIDAFDASFDANFAQNFSSATPASASQNGGGANDQQDNEKVKNSETDGQQPSTNTQETNQLSSSEKKVVDTYNPFSSTPPPSSVPSSRAYRPSHAVADDQPDATRGSSKSPTPKPGVTPSTGNQQSEHRQTRDPPGRNRTSGKVPSPIVKTSGAFAPTVVSSSVTPSSTAKSARGANSAESAVSRGSSRSQSAGRFHFRNTTSPPQQQHSVPLGAVSRSSNTAASGRHNPGHSPSINAAVAAAGAGVYDAKTNGSTQSSPKSNGPFRSPTSAAPYGASPATGADSPRSQSTPRGGGFSPKNGVGSASSLDNRFRAAAGPSTTDEKFVSDSARSRYEKAIQAHQRTTNPSALNTNNDERTTRSKTIPSSEHHLVLSPSQRDSAPHMPQLRPSSSAFKKMDEETKLETSVPARSYFAKRTTPLDDQVRARRDLSGRNSSSPAEATEEERKVITREYLTSTGNRRTGSSTRNLPFAKSRSSPNVVADGEQDKRGVVPVRQSQNGNNSDNRLPQHLSKHTRDSSYSSIEEKKTDDVQPDTPTRLSVKDRVSMFTSSASPRSPVAEHARLRRSSLDESPKGKFLDAGDIPLVSSLRKPNAAGMKSTTPSASSSRHLHVPPRLWGDEEIDG